eukprot:GGOE01049344.1.p2 GENE.GGOE01049344.1~~GGOE01049344.1.p2  ORF type:complete len:118 (+),score=28.43 GGOE01049344.1:52-405(+)
MIIPIRCVNGSQKWDLIDLQGTLASLDGSPLTERDLGTLTVRNKKCTLVIGGHSLEGTVLPEKRNLAILKKRKREEVDSAAHDGAEMEQAPVEYEMIGTVGRRFLFNKRPDVALAKG